MIKKNKFKQKNFIWAIVFLSLFIIFIGVLCNFGNNIKSINEWLDNHNDSYDEWNEYIRQKEIYKIYICGFSFLDISFFISFSFNVFWIFKDNENIKINNKE